MQIESILRSVLVADPAVAALVGDRIYRKRLPRESTFPAITFQMITRPQDGLTGVVRARIQYNCYAAPKQDLVAATLADAVRCALHGYRAVRDGARIEYVEYVNAYDFTDETTEIPTIPVDMIVTYLEET